MSARIAGRWTGPIPVALLVLGVTIFLCTALADLEVERRDGAQRDLAADASRAAVDTFAAVLDELAGEARALAMAARVARTDSQLAEALVEVRSSSRGLVDHALVLEEDGAVVAAEGPASPPEPIPIPPIEAGVQVIGPLAIEPGAEVLLVVSPTRMGPRDRVGWAAVATDVGRLAERAAVEEIWRGGYDYELVLKDPRRRTSRAVSRGRESEIADPVVVSASRDGWTWDLRLAPRTGWDRAASKWILYPFAVVLGMLAGGMAYLGRRRTRADPEIERRIDQLRHVNRFLIEKVGEGRDVARQLTLEASHDSITGLPNQDLFLARTESALKSARVDGTGIGVLCIGLDRFLHTVDSLGTSAANDMLVSAARNLVLAVSPEASLARLPEGRFAVLICGTDVEETCAATADRVRGALRGTLVLNDVEVLCTASTGTAIASTGYEPALELVERASVALRQAQSGASDASLLFDPSMTEEAARALELESELRLALERQEFTLHFQPIVALEDGALVGAESLIRWEHPVEGRMSPGDFLDTAVRSGLIVPITQWVIREACRQVSEWRAAGAVPDHFYVAVNISGRDLAEPDLPDYVSAICEEMRVPAGSLRLEVTESVLIQNLRTAAETLAAIREGGVPILLDDFGTGYSSLSYLNRFGFDILKIDRSFLAAIVDWEQNAGLLTSILILARNLGMRAVAEGLETPEQLAALRRLGCDYGQGYYFSPPVPPAKFIALLESGRDWGPSIRLLTGSG